MIPYSVRGLQFGMWTEPYIPRWDLFCGSAILPALPWCLGRFKDINPQPQVSLGLCWLRCNPKILLNHLQDPELNWLCMWERNGAEFSGFNQAWPCDLFNPIKLLRAGNVCSDMGGTCLSTAILWESISIFCVFRNTLEFMLLFPISGLTSGSCFQLCGGGRRNDTLLPYHPAEHHWRIGTRLQEFGYFGTSTWYISLAESLWRLAF